MDAARTLFVLVDGYATRISSLIEALFNIFGLELNFIGGGAGSINPDVLDIAQKPCLLSNEGLLSDSALLAMLDNESGIGVCHGWKKIYGPLKITESHGNVLLSLDWRPAFSVYREIVDRFSEEPITNSNFFNIAKGFPFGISRLEQEKIVRDPFAVDGNAITFGVDMPTETFVDIMTGDQASLIRAADRAFTGGHNAYNGDSAKRNILFMDCISRVLFLGDKLQEALASVKTLKGMLPICANCKNIRDDRGYWNAIEVYIGKHSDTLFSHCICPKCAEELYGNEEWFKKESTPPQSS
jgi:hypothetical protein